MNYSCFFEEQKIDKVSPEIVCNKKIIEKEKKKKNRQIGKNKSFKVTRLCEYLKSRIIFFQH